MLFLRVQVSAVTSNWWLAGTLPDGYRPSDGFYSDLAVLGEDQTAKIWISPDGSVRLISDQKLSSSTCWAMVAAPLW